MSERALSEGVEAFKRGLTRSANPFDPSTEDWMCWRDGFDQAQAVAARREDVSQTPAIGAAAAN